jgi:hypothetical protein
MKGRIMAMVDILHMLRVCAAMLLCGFLALHSFSAAGSQAQEMSLTVYDDGLACPAGCDAHVVFHPIHNGTANAHLPGGAQDEEFKDCVAGQPCRICFDGNPGSCMDVMYRGAGPHQNRFDFTPAFFQENCSKVELPIQVKSKCREISAQAEKLDKRINCIKEKNHPKCNRIMDEAIRLKQKDQPLYAECIERGEKKFNADHDPAEQRKDKCAYQKERSRVRGRLFKTYFRLLPAACPQGTYVGRDGFDCCSGNPWKDGILYDECDRFYPQR